MANSITSNTPINLALNMFTLSTGYTKGSGSTGEIGASTGGGSFSAVPQIIKPDINGLRKYTKGFDRIHEWEVSVKLTNVEFNETGLLLATGYGSAATLSTVTTITPAQGLIPDSEYADLWISGMTADGKKYAIKLANAINENGIMMSFEERNNGKYDLELFANYTIAALDTPPFEVIIDKSVTTADAIALSTIAPADGSTGAVATVVCTFNNAISEHDIKVILASTGAIIAGASAYDATRKIITFTPTSAFAAALHIVSVAGVKDIYGQVLTTVTKTFTVA